MVYGRVMELAPRHVLQEHNKEIEYVIHQPQCMVGKIVALSENRLIQDYAIRTLAQVKH